MEGKKTWVAAIIIVVTYLVGILGFAFNATKGLFEFLVPYHLLMVFIILLIVHKKWDVRFALFLVLTFIISFSAEYVGVQTGMLFGDYYYSNVLGIKYGGVPLLIGINWIMLVYITTSLSGFLVRNIFLSSILGAGIMALLDVVMEPGAVKLRFWTWTLNFIPVYNYICWFGLSFILILSGKILRINANMYISLIILISQLMFFLTMYLH